MESNAIENVKQLSNGWEKYYIGLQSLSKKLPLRILPDLQWS